MIWHFAEVWLLIVMTFIVGCVLGAFLYGVLADSRFAVAQGVIADGIGDAIDRIKARFGLAPAWRPRQMSGVARPALPAAREIVAVEAEPESEEEEAPPIFEEEADIHSPQLPPREEPRPAATKTLLPRRPEPPRLPQPDEPRAPPPVEEPVTPGDPLRVASAMLVARDGIVPKRPAGLASPRGGVPDNLTRIKGIGQRNEELLNSLGIFHFGQIASWTPAEARWIGQYLAFPERIDRDNWIAQATMLASGVDTGFEKSADRRRRRRQQLQEERLARQAAAVASGNAAIEGESPIDPADAFAEQVRAARPRPAEVAERARDADATEHVDAGAQADESVSVDEDEDSR